MSTLWHGRFEDGPAEELMAFTVSLPFDSRLAADDLAGSRAHVRGLARAGILTEDECASVLSALDAVEVELLNETFVFVSSDEDIHTAVERRVTEIAGPAGAKLHTGRSRNDQVATDLRLFTKRELGVVIDKVIAMQRVLLSALRKLATPQCLAIPTCSAHSRYCSRTIFSLMVGRFHETSIDSSTLVADSTFHPLGPALSLVPRCHSIRLQPPKTSGLPTCSQTRSMQ